MPASIAHPLGVASSLEASLIVSSIGTQSLAPGQRRQSLSYNDISRNGMKRHALASHLLETWLRSNIPITGAKAFSGLYPIRKAA
jgi:hypothetical protein